MGEWCNAHTRNSPLVASMPKKDQFAIETEIQIGNIYAALLSSIEDGLRNAPEAAHAFDALMWLVGDAVRNGSERVTLITKIVNDSISVAYVHTSDHRNDHEAGLERFKSVLADECGAE